MTLSNFYRGTKVQWNSTITHNGSNPDISADTVSIIFKSDKNMKDADAEINVNANVANQGTDGVAEFTLSITDTDVIPGTYYYSEKWITSGGDVYILEEDTISVLQSLFE